MSATPNDENLGSAISDASFRTAASDQSQITGLTHGFYRYPARFSPQFAAAAIERFSKPGDVVLDPFAGGGTTVVEALVRGRQIVASDINSLGVFVARVKTTPLTRSERNAITAWVETIQSVRYTSRKSKSPTTPDRRLYNMSLPHARYIRKMVALALEEVESLPTASSKEFARCAILRTGQWALDGRRQRASVHEFREMLTNSVSEMLNGLAAFVTGGSKKLTKGLVSTRRTLIQGDAGELHQSSRFRNARLKAKLVVTSPPYPGVHVLYHRWQVDGRKETPAPYWIAQCNDGEGGSYYTFGGRHQRGQKSYFETSLRTLMAIRKVIHPDGTFVQLVGFSNPRTQLPKYLSNMEKAGFRELFLGKSGHSSRASRIWRSVPNRKWHANLAGKTSSSQEVVLIHKPV